jgi:hypothetical protein
MPKRSDERVPLLGVLASTANVNRLEGGAREKGSFQVLRVILGAE